MFYSAAVAGFRRDCRLQAADGPVAWRQLWAILVLALAAAPALLAMDQLANQMAKLRYMSGGQFVMPVTIRAQAGAGTAEAAQHSQSPEGWFMNVPGLKIVIPATPYDAKGLLIASIENDNPVLFLDEPTVKLDATGAQAVRAFIRRINQELNITVIIIEHLMKVLKELSSRLMILHYGEEIRTGPPAEVMEDEKVREVYLG